MSSQRGICKAILQGRINLIIAGFVWVLGAVASAAGAEKTQIVSQEVVLVTKAGAVKYKPGGKDWLDAVQGQAVHFNDQIRTLAASRATLRVADLTDLQIGENSLVEILAPPPRTRANFDFKAGFFRLFTRNKSGEVRLKTRRIAAGNRGTELNVEVDGETGRTVLTVDDGEVDVTTLETNLTIHSEEQWTFESGRQWLVVERTDVVQWWLFYPAVLNPDELNLSVAEEADLATSLAAYRRGNLIIDISDPTAPVLVGTAKGPIFTVATSGAYAYVDVAEVIDVGDSRIPTYLKDPYLNPNYQPERKPVGLGIFTSGNRAYIFGGEGFAGETSEVYFLRSSTQRLYVYDLTNRKNPSRVNDTEINLFSLNRDLSIRENYGFAGGLRAFVVFDFATSQRFDQTTAVDVRTIDTKDNLAVVGGGNGLEIFDITNPTNPLPRGRFGALGAATNAFVDLALNNRRIITIETNGGLHVIDANDPYNPIQIASYTATGFEKVALAGNFAVIAHGADGLTILDLGPSFATAPGISFQPQNQRALPGATIRFDVGANGTVPLTYQWQLNGTNLPSATNFVLRLANVQTNQAGQYSVIISNSVGVTASSNAVLSVDFPPSVTLTAPASDEIFLAPATITLAAEASDPDTNASVAQVAFYEVANLLGMRTHAPFSITLSNVPVGTYVFTARATDNEGASTTSDPVTNSVVTNRVFQLSKPEYAVDESNEVVTVTVRRNTDGAASVVLFTQNGSAKAIVPGGVGQYYAISNVVLVFDTNQLSQEIRITNVNDLVYRGDRNYFVKLSNPSVGWDLAFPSNSVVTILDNEFPTNNIFPDVALPGSATGGRGSLTIHIEPPAALGQWRFPWETAWRESGSTASNLVTGDYPVKFSALDGYGPLTNVTYCVQGGTNRVYTKVLTGTNVTQFGSLSVRILPGTVANAADSTARGQWRLLGTTDWFDSEAVTNLAAGLRLVEFKPLVGFETPPQLYAELAPNQTVIYERAYLPPATELILPRRCRRRLWRLWRIFDFGYECARLVDRHEFETIAGVSGGECAGRKPGQDAQTRSRHLRLQSRF